MKKYKESETPTCCAEECFGCQDGRCTVLSKNNFGTKKCPFFKTREQAETERANCEQRLANIRINSKQEEELC